MKKMTTNAIKARALMLLVREQQETIAAMEDGQRESNAALNIARFERDRVYVEGKKESEYQSDRADKAERELGTSRALARGLIDERRAMIAFARRCASNSVSSDGSAALRVFARDVVKGKHLENGGKK